MASSSSTDFRFFSIIFKTTLEQNMLELPKKFVRIYGKILSSSVFLRPPCGSKWKLGLLKRGNKVWLDQGWPEFAKYYALGFGHVLFFKYKGNSQFQVSICDVSTCAIQYPSIPAHLDKPNVNGPKKGETVGDDDSVQIFANSSSSDEEHTPPSSPPHRRMGNNAGSQCMDTARQHGQCQYRDSKAYEAASKFSSTKPFFKSVVTNTYSVRLPTAFVKRHLEQNAETIRLKVGASSWRVRVAEYQTGYFLSSGYSRFSKENSLHRGDVCVYELTEKKNTSGVVLKVYIFRGNML